MNFQIIVSEAQALSAKPMKQTAKIMIQIIFFILPPYVLLPDFLFETTIICASMICIKHKTNLANCE
jgi:hypothetical protein